MSNDFELPTKGLERACPVCGGRLGRVLGRLEFALFDCSTMARAFDVVGCTDCGFVFHDTPDGAEDFIRFYSEEYFSSGYVSAEPNALLDAVVHSERDPLTIVIPHLRSRSAKICEIGCGRGALLAALKRAGYARLFGVDPSRPCIDFVRGHCVIDAAVGSASSIPGDSMFDLIIATHVLEHILDLSAAMESIASRLTEEGLVYVEVPDLQRYSAFPASAPLDYIAVYEHINHFTMMSLQGLFSRHGLRLCESGRKTLNVSSRFPMAVVYGLFRNGGDDRGEPARGARSCSPNMNREIHQWLTQRRFRNHDRLVALARSQIPVYVWGINLPVMRMLAMSPLRECNVRALIDRDPAKQLKTVGGRPIAAPTVLEQLEGDVVVVVWGGPYAEGMQQHLTQIGFAGELMVL